MKTIRYILWIPKHVLQASPQEVIEYLAEEVHVHINITFDFMAGKYFNQSINLDAASSAKTIPDLFVNSIA